MKHRADTGRGNGARQFEGPNGGAANHSTWVEPIRADDLAPGIEEYELERLGHPEPVDRPGSEQEPSPFAPRPQSTHPLPEGHRDPNRLETPTTVTYRNRIARPIRNTVWYAPAHGKGKAKKTPRPPLEGEPRPPPQRRPRLASRPSAGVLRITTAVCTRPDTGSRGTAHEVSSIETWHQVPDTAGRQAGLPDTPSGARLTDPVGSSGRRLRWDRWMPRSRRRRRLDR
jgi:hypothetical protein